MKKILVTICSIVVLAYFVYLGCQHDPNTKVQDNSEWSVQQFIDWGKEVQPVIAHMKWKQNQDEKEVLMEPNHPLNSSIILEPNDVRFMYPEYFFGWIIYLPQDKDQPEPVKKAMVQMTVKNVSKKISDILPNAKNIMEIAAFVDNEVVSSENIELILMAVAEGRVIVVKTEPFIISDNPKVHGRVNGRLVLYAPKDANVNIMKGTR